MSKARSPRLDSSTTVGIRACVGASGTSSGARAAVRHRLIAAMISQ